MQRFLHTLPWWHKPRQSLLPEALRQAGIRNPVAQPRDWDRVKTIGHPLDPRDPISIGYDRIPREGLAAYTEETDRLDYVNGGSDTVDLLKNRLITAIDLVADPFDHSVQNAPAVIVQDAQDKVLSGVNIVGGPTYFSLNNTITFLKAISNLNKMYYPALGRDDLLTPVNANNLSFQGWRIQFGAWADNDPFDITSGIPAEDETSLSINAIFGLNNLIATVGANATILPSTDIRVVTYGVQAVTEPPGVQSVGPDYRARLPIPDFRHDHRQNPVTNTRFDLLTGRYLKRTTILNLAVNAANNEPRNDGNVTDISVVFEKPVRTLLIDRIGWRTFKNNMQGWRPGPQIDKDGAATIAPGGLAGVAVIDWRDFSHNPFGLDLGVNNDFRDGDVHIDITMGTLTGSIHLFNEFYAFPDPSVPLLWNEAPRQVLW